MFYISGMDAKELRIGNWVMVVDEDSPVKVTGVWDDAIKYKESGEVAGRLKPIPLTPEILEKAGFRLGETWYIHKVYYRGNFEILVNKHEIVYGEKTENGFNSIRQLKSIHQLQNLYFALTGEELEINL